MKLSKRARRVLDDKIDLRWRFSTTDGEKTVLLCIVHPDSEVEFPDGFWKNIERVNDNFCPRDYAHLVHRYDWERMNQEESR